MHGFVNHKMHEGGARIDIPRRNRRQVGVIKLLAAMRGQMDVDIRQFAHFMMSNAAPVAAHHGINTLEAVAQVHHGHVELRAGAALQKQNFIVVWNIQKLAQILLGMIEDAHEHVGAVAHGHHGKARAVVVEHFALRSAQYGFGQHGRAGGEVVNRGIHSKNSIENVAGCLNGWGFYRLQTRCSKDFRHFPPNSMAVKNYSLPTIPSYQK